MNDTKLPENWIDLLDGSIQLSDVLKQMRKAWHLAHRNDPPAARTFAAQGKLYRRGASLWQQARALVLHSFKAYVPRLHKRSNRFRLVSEQPRDGYLSNIAGAWRQYSAGMLA